MPDFWRTVHARDLTMEGKKEWAILDEVKIQAIEASGEVERANERALVRE
jgi:hypothetical protein